MNIVDFCGCKVLLCVIMSSYDRYETRKWQHLTRS